mmetsp:Transcript_19921/g.46506  ORF Transcript_19921/g.46506 Transcript_19921/m.46506 type:complete len:342 (+) Transcript_19921:357-1382(+)
MFSMNTKEISVKAGAAFDRSQSAVSTAVMANTSERGQRKLRTKVYQRHLANENSETAPKEEPSSTRRIKGLSSSFLNRLTIVETESSSSSSRKKRRKKRIAMRKQAQASPPQELLVHHNNSLQDSISAMPDGSFEQIASNSRSQNATASQSSQKPVLFTFDVVPSMSLDTNHFEQKRDHKRPNDKDDGDCGNTKNTADANFNPCQSYDSTKGSSTDDTDCYASDANKTTDAAFNPFLSEKQTKTSYQKFNRPRSSRSKVSKKSRKEKAKNKDKGKGKGKEKGKTDTITDTQVVKQTHTDSTACLTDNSSSYEVPDILENGSTEFHVKASRCNVFNLFSIFE